MDKLKFIAEQMEHLAIPYSFGTWNAEIQYPYWVGEYTESPTNAENGYEECVFILTGTTRGAWLELEEAKEQIKQHFSAYGGLRDETESGAIAVFYSGAMTIPTKEADLKRIQINLDIKEWKGIDKYGYYR